MGTIACKTVSYECSVAPLVTCSVETYGTGQGGWGVVSFLHISNANKLLGTRSDTFEGRTLIYVWNDEKVLMVERPKPLSNVMCIGRGAELR